MNKQQRTLVCRPAHDISFDSRGSRDRKWERQLEEWLQASRLQGTLSKRDPRSVSACESLSRFACHAPRHAFSSVQTSGA